MGEDKKPFINHIFLCITRFYYFRFCYHYCLYMLTKTIQLAESTEAGRLGVLHLKRYWSKGHLKKSGQLAQNALSEEWKIDTTLLALLGLGLEQTFKHLYLQAPDFDEFETWILEINNGQLSQPKIDEFNNYIRQRTLSHPQPSPDAAILTEAEMDFWKENGYVIVREAVSCEDCAKAIEAICNFIDVELDNPATWYNYHPARQGIMVQLFQHPALEKNRRSPRIRAAYEQIWNRTDLWMNTDRTGFNPPETSQWKFPGPRLHWDVSLQLPIPFGSQGILYLSDTQANQGAFTLVSGFHNRIETWLHSLPPGTNPRTENLYALGATPIVANAGDFIIWHQALPHGSSVNTSSLPRIVQYINYAPLDEEVRENWI